jgi:hypothetical protein
MITRRMLILSGAISALTAAEISAQAPSPNDPVAIVNSIYTRAAERKGDGGGGFVYENKTAKAKFLSKSLIALWARADAHTPKDDVGPVDFDPVTNSQDPDVKSFKVDAENLAADKAVIAATIADRYTPPRKPADHVVRYDFVRDGSQWKINDIRGSSDGEPWSIRAMLSHFLKN